MIKNQLWLISQLFISVLILSSCTQNQDDVELPVYDALGGDFTLPSTLGKPLTLSEFEGKIVLINFGYTSCPDICPMVLTNMDKLAKELSSKYFIGTDKLQTIFITVDPERDTIPRIKEYLQFFNTDIIGVSGSANQITELTKRYAVFYEKLPQQDTDYQVAHTDKIFLLDKRGRLRGLYSISENKEKLLTNIISLNAAEI